MSLEQAHLTALVTFISPASQGRQTPVASGYRGQFFYNDMDCDAIHLFEEDREVPFGREVVDYIVLINPYHHSRIHEGLIFLIREGKHTIGYGQVVEVKMDINGQNPADMPNA